MNDVAEPPARAVMEVAVLEVAGLSVRYRVRGGWLDAVRDLSLHVGAGEAVGLVGESGSGKSSVALAVLRYLPRGARVAAQRLALEGSDLMALSPAALRRVRGARIGAVYQDPGAALNPVLTVGRQIGEVLQQHRGLSAAAAREAAAGLLDRMRVARPQALLDLFPHELSGGLQQRVIIAAAIATEPALLVLDEPTTALDASVRAEITDILDTLRRETRTALLLISHDIHLVRGMADRVGVMRRGTMLEYGPSQQVLRAPRHPYTRGLLNAVPRDGLTKYQARLASVDEADEPLAPAPLQKPLPPGIPAPAVLECRGVTQRLGGRIILRDVDLAIAPGETLGLIGESGSGKSTLARIVAGLQRPLAGDVRLDGSLLPGRFAGRTRAQRRAVQMVFQSPDRTLNPRHRAVRTIARPLRRLQGLGGQALRQQRAALLDAVRLSEETAQRRPAALSGGQRQRIAIARALAGAPRLMILDEPTSALDASVQALILNLLVDLQSQTGIAYLFISHDLDVIRYMADRIAVLYRGRIVETGPADRVFTGPCHPYTGQLMQAGSVRPRAEPPQATADVVEVTSHAPDLCVFRQRCPVAMARCSSQPPPWRQDGAAHAIRCWHELPQLQPRDTASHAADVVHAGTALT